MFVIRALPLLAASLVACTQANPGYEGSPDGGCTPGQRTCSGQSSLVCLPTGYATERICPMGSICQSGLCIGSGQVCGGTCDTGKVCTALVAPTLTGLGNYCVSVVGTRAGNLPCTKDSECQSGLCLKQGYCFRACYQSQACGALTHCAELTLTLSGIQGKVYGCVPN
jgi:hypothetical protein